MATQLTLPECGVSSMVGGIVEGILRLYFARRFTLENGRWCHYIKVGVSRKSAAERLKHVQPKGSWILIREFLAEKCYQERSTEELEALYKRMFRDWGVLWGTDTEIVYADQLRPHLLRVLSESYAKRNALKDEYELAQSQYEKRVARDREVGVRTIAQKNADIGNDNRWVVAHWKEYEAKYRQLWYEEWAAEMLFFGAYGNFGQPWPRLAVADHPAGNGYFFPPSGSTFLNTSSGHNYQFRDGHDVDWILNPDGGYFVKA